MNTTSFTLTLKLIVFLVESAPPSNLDRYSQEVKAGLYPKETIPQSSTNQEELQLTNVLPWIYSPARDFAMSIGLVEELLLLIITIITEMPSPPPRNHDESAMEARRRLRREVLC